MSHRIRPTAREAIILLVLVALALPASAAFNDTGAMQAWVKSDLQGNVSTNQTIISIPAEISSAEDGLVGLWHFNNENGTSGKVVDSSGLNNSGDCVGVGGDVCNWTAGMFGQGIRFDGVDDYVNCSNDTSLNPGTGDFSVAFWLGPRAEVSGWSWIITKHKESDDSGFIITTTSNKLRVS